MDCYFTSAEVLNHIHAKRLTQNNLANTDAFCL